MAALLPSLPGDPDCASDGGRKVAALLRISGLRATAYPWVFGGSTVYCIRYLSRIKPYQTIIITSSLAFQVSVMWPREQANAPRHASLVHPPRSPHRCPSFPPSCMLLQSFLPHMWQQSMQTQTLRYPCFLCIFDIFSRANDPQNSIPTAAGFPPHVMHSACPGHVVPWQSMVNSWLN